MLCDWASCVCACHERMVVYFFIQTQILYSGMPVKISQKINKSLLPLHFQSSSAAHITSATCSCLIYLFSLNYYSRVSLSITPHVPDFNVWWPPILPPLCETPWPGSSGSGWHLAGKLSPVMMQITLFINPDILLYSCVTDMHEISANSACILDLCINSGLTPSYLPVTVVVQTRCGPHLHHAVEPGRTSLTAH